LPGVGRAWTVEVLLLMAAAVVPPACRPAASPFLVQWFELEVARVVSGLFQAGPAAVVLLAAEPSSGNGRVGSVDVEMDKLDSDLVA